MLNGADAIVFTAGVGENAENFRRDVISGISWFGCDVDDEKNVFGVTGDISTEAAKIRVLVIPTDEELVIARDVERLKKISETKKIFNTRSWESYFSSFFSDEIVQNLAMIGFF